MTFPSRRCARLALVALIATASCGAPELAPPQVDPSSRRDPPAGSLVGFTGRYGSHAWLAIPYAAPPVGPLRWRAPRPAPRWEGVRESLAAAEPCPQFASPFSGAARGATGVIGNEDCLTLDVWAPRFEPGAATRAAARPVMVWIHGGGNSIGSTSFYDGGNLAASQDVVVVAIQYRLGPLGWLAHEALRDGAGNDLDRSGNFGTLDTIRALEWVRDNIAAFGGDPANVTVFGESAGGTNVMALLISPRAAGLFHRAILQSPGFQTETAAAAERFHDEAEGGHAHSASEAIARLMLAAGDAGDRAAARARMAAMPAAELAAWLRGRTPAQLLAGYPEADEGMLVFPSVIRDGVVIPDEDPLALLARGAYHRVPTILGTNRDEDKLFMAFDPEYSRWRFGIFPQAHDPDLYSAQARASANAWKALAVDEPARLMRAVQGPTVYGYRWDWDEEPSLPLLFDGRRMIGAAHGLEIPFVFGHWDLGPESGRLFGRGNREGREALSAQMMSYWAQFAASGSPGRGRRGDLPEWSAWDASSPEAPKYALLDTPAGGGVRMASETWTLDRVVAEVLADPRLTDARKRCQVLRTLALWDYLEIDDYAKVGDGACSAYAFDAYPWGRMAATGRE
jgi:para-nitrobenzyl esterase